MTLLSIQVRLHFQFATIQTTYSGKTPYVQLFRYYLSILIIHRNEWGGCLQFRIILLTGFGFIFLALGAIGLLLPVWPTTPFVLLSAACFSCTPRLRAQIMKIPFFKEHIENYEHKTGLSRKTVIISLSYLWGMLLFSMLILKNVWIACLLLFIGTSVTIHILCIAKAKKKNEKNETYSD